MVRGVDWGTVIRRLGVSVSVRLLTVAARRRCLRSYDKPTHLPTGLPTVAHVASYGGHSPQRASNAPRAKVNGAGNGIRTRDFDLGKVALYH